MWYRQTLEVVRIRNALRALLAGETLADAEAVAEMLDELRQIALDDSHPAGGADLRREYERWRARAQALALNARNN
ncbi:MAG TPA: hypothetical protein VKN99_11715 [Polyangia bacterium]|nr:hypothetical protein [Polyangia bacterium]